MHRASIDRVSSCKERNDGAAVSQTGSGKKYFMPWSLWTFVILCIHVIIISSAERGL